MLYTGHHLSHWSLAKEFNSSINASSVKNIMVNSRSRYHYLAIEKGVLGVGQSGGLGHLGDMIGKVNC